VSSGGREHSFNKKTSREDLELDVDERIILKQILEKYCVKGWTGFK
jgi:hypothetical protein